MSDVVYIMETQDPRELWLVEGENKFRISRDMYWLLVSNGAELPPTHSITELLAENAKLRELCADMWHVMWACAEQRCKHRENECYVVNGNNGALPSHDECWYKRRMRELGVEVE